MAIERVLVPTPTAPLTITDYQAILAQAVAASQAFTGREIVDGSTIRAGTVMLIGNVLYKAVSDTAISGTASLYVKITPSGATATAAFVSSLSSVAWNHAYGGYYDGSGSGGNLVVFDEGVAVASGVVTAPMTERGRSAGPRKRTFTASGTFVVPTGVTEVYVTGCAAGGNGLAGTPSPGPYVGGNGGGPGAHVSKKKIVVTPGESITVTLGAIGSNTTFGSYLTLPCGIAGKGGIGGSAGVSGGYAPGGGGLGGGSYSTNVGGGGGGAPGPFGGDTGTSGSAGNSSGGSGGINGGGGGGGGASATGGTGGNGVSPGSGGGGAGGGFYAGSPGSGGPPIITVEW